MLLFQVAAFMEGHPGSQEQIKRVSADKGFIDSFVIEHNNAEMT